MFILPGALACVCTSLALGLAVIRALRLRVTKAESVLLGYVLGAAVASTITLALGLAGAIGGTVFALLGGVSFVALCAQYRWFRELPGSEAEYPTPWKLLLLAGFVAYGLLYFRQALAPEMSSDGMAYHLGFVNLWNHAGRIYRIEEMTAAFPNGMEMLFLFAFSIGGHSAAALIHFSFLMELPLLMLLCGRRFQWPPAGTALATILVFASPLAGVDGTVAYVDVGLAAVALAAVYLLGAWRENHSAGDLIGCGLLTGFAIAIKYTAAPLGLLVAVVVAWDLRRSYASQARALALLLPAIAAACVPYFVRNWIWFDDPVAPFGYAVFPSHWFHIWRLRIFIEQEAFHDGVRWRDLPIALTAGGSKLNSSFGPAFLLLPFCLPGLIWRKSRLFTIAALTLASGFAANKDPRFLIPAVAPAALSMGFVLSQVRAVNVMNVVFLVTAAAHMVVSWPAFAGFVHFPAVWQWRINPVSWRDALRIRPESEYLTQSSDYVMARRIESLVPEGEPVLSSGGGAAQSYTTRRLMTSWGSAPVERMADLLYAKWHSPNSWKRFRFTFPAVDARRLRIVQTGADKVFMWTVSEVELRSGGRLLPVSPGWRLSASPNPWDIGAAFDGSLVTHWRSWEVLRPGMFIAVDFAPTEKLDSVEVVLDYEWTETETQVLAARLYLSVEAADGKMLRVDPTVSADPPQDLRAAATKALESEGVHFLLIHRSSWMQQKFTEVPSEWHMHEIARTADATLYHLD